MFQNDSFDGTFSWCDGPAPTLLVSKYLLAYYLNFPNLLLIKREKTKKRLVMKKLVTIAVAASFAFAGVASAQSTCVFSRSLSVGSTGADVLALQQKLNMDPVTQVATTGVGSPGMETSYYGPLTANAVTRYQNINAATVLAPLGLAKGTGYFGPSTIASICSMSSTTPTNDYTPTANQFDGDEETDINSFEVNDADDTNLNEGEEDVVLAEVEFDVEDAPARLTRADFVFDGEGNDEEDPWDVFDALWLEIDGDKVAEVEADDRDEWDEDNYDSGTGDDGYDEARIRFSKINHDFDIDDNHKVLLVGDIAGSVDGADGGTADWDIFVPNRNSSDGFLFIDPSGIIYYQGEGDSSASDIAEITIGEEGGDDELTVRDSDEDPSATGIEVEDTESSDYETVHVFEIDVDEDSADLTFNDIYFTLITGTADVADVVKEVQIEVDGDVYSDWSFSSPTDGADSEVQIQIDLDGDLEVDSDDTVDVEVQVKFKAADGINYDEGETITVLVQSSDVDDWDVENGDDLDSAQLKGNSEGDTHTLLINGATVELSSTSTQVLDSSDTVKSDISRFTFVVEVNAFDDPIYIDTTASSAFGFDIINASSGSVDENSPTIAINTGASITSGYYRVSSTEKFTITITQDGDTANAEYYAVLTDMNFNDTAAAADATINLDTDEFRTDTVYEISN